jgi:hypothetical protein
MVVLRVVVLLIMVGAGCSQPLPVRKAFGGGVPRGPVTFAVIGDQQRTAPFEVWREFNTIHEELVRQAMHASPSAILLLGDQVYRGDDPDEWRFFDHIMRPVARAGIPVYPLVGNHEYFGRDAVAFANMRNRFPAMPDRFYSMVIDSVAFIMLDTNFDEYARDSTVRQFRWFKTRLRQYTKDRSVRCIVVCGHHPPYTNSAIVPPDHILQRYFVPVFQRSPKARLWLSGHCHAYEHFRHGNIHFVVSGGGGGPRQFLRLDSLTHTDHDLYRGGPIRPFHYLTIQREAASLCVTMTPLEGQGAHGETFTIDPMPTREDQ